MSPSRHVIKIFFFPFTSLIKQTYLLTVQFCKFTPVLNILIQLIPQLSKQYLFRVSIKDQYLQHSDVYTAGWTQTAPLQFLPGIGKPQGLETKAAVMKKHLKSAGLTLCGSL